MKTRSALLAAIVLLSAGGIAAFAQFTPGTGGTYVVPTPPTPPRPVTPAPNPPAQQPAGQPTYSWEIPFQPSTPPTLTPPYPQQPQPVVQQQPEMVRIVSGPVVIGGVEYLPTPQGYIPRLSDNQIGDLTASIALYPDPLLAEIFPASAYVEQLTYVEKWLIQHPGANDRMIDALPVDESVKTIMRYPTVLSMLTDHLDWTQAMGLAFLYQRGDLMDSVQRWRRLAVSYGTLASTPQLDVFRQGDMILILPPSRQQVIYVPVYNPQVVYVRPVRPVPIQNVLTFSAGGFSLSFVNNDLDWQGRNVRVPVRRDRDRDNDGPGRGGPGRDGPGRGDPGRGGGDRGGGDRGGGDRGGRGSSVVVTADRPPEKTNFTYDASRPGIMYPDRIVTPQQDKKVVTIPAATRPAPRLPTPAPAPSNSIIVTPSLPTPSTPSPGRGGRGG